MIFKFLVLCAIAILAGCSYAEKREGELNAVAMGDTCAAASDGDSYAISCATPEREKILRGILLFNAEKLKHARAKAPPP